MAPIRLLYVLDSLAPAGTSDLVGHLLTRLDRGRFEPRVIGVRGAGPPRPTSAEEAGAVRFRRLDTPASQIVLSEEDSFRARSRRLARRLRVDAPHVVHAHSRPADLWSTWAAAAAGVPVRIYSRQATYGGMPALTRGRYALTARLATRVVAVSRAVQEHLTRREGVPRRRIELIHDAIDLEGLAPITTAAPLHERLGIAPGAPLVGCVASLTDRKGQRHLVDAAQHIRTRVPDAHFILVGDGPGRDALETRIASAGLQDAFRLVGWQDRVAEWIAAFDVFVLPSLWEGLNLSLLTACALGRAVVATNLASNREIVEPGVSGLLPTPGRAALEASGLDPRALADAVVRLLLEPDLRQRFGEAARQRVTLRFGAGAMTARHADLYERLLRDRS